MGCWLWTVGCGTWDVGCALGGVVCVRGCGLWIRDVQCGSVPYAGIFFALRLAAAVLSWLLVCFVGLAVVLTGASGFCGWLSWLACRRCLRHTRSRRKRTRRFHLGSRRCRLLPLSNWRCDDRRRSTAQGGCWRRCDVLTVYGVGTCAWSVLGSARLPASLVVPGRARVSVRRAVNRN